MSPSSIIRGVRHLWRPPRCSLQPSVEWLKKYSKRFSTFEFFVGGGGVAVADFDDASELNRVVLEMPFTQFTDVEITPVVDPSVATARYGETFAAMAAAVAPPAGG